MPHSFAILVDGVAYGVNVTEKQDGSPKGRFTSGACGYNLNAKLTIDGKPHQLGCNITEIGSKPGGVAVKGGKAVAAKL